MAVKSFIGPRLVSHLMREEFIGIGTVVGTGTGTAHAYFSE
jgi:hypothetical protein